MLYYYLKKILEVMSLKNDNIYKTIVFTLVFLIIIVSCAIVSMLIFNYNDIRKFNKTESEAFYSSGDHSTEEITFPYSKLTAYKPTEQNVRPIGRTVYNDDVLWFSMSGCGAEFNCSGVYAEIKLCVYNSQYITYNHRPRIAVFSDDVLVLDMVLEEDEQTLMVELDPFSENTVIKIIKLSESMYSSVGISEISVFSDKQISPTDGDKLKIEFIGDSITCGYGLDEESSYAAFSTRTENFAKTYAYLASNAVNAECYAVAFSGYGVLSGFTSNGVIQDEYVIKNRYDKAVTGMNFDDDYLYEWSFQKYQPDIVVINLGTNDASYCSTKERRERFCEEYQNLLIQIRENNPQAFIICILGDMNNSLYPSIKQSASDYVLNYNDYRISCTTIAFEMGTYGSTIDGHPNIDSNILAAQTFEQYLKEHILDIL